MATGRDRVDRIIIDDDGVMTMRATENDLWCNDDEGVMTMMV